MRTSLRLMTGVARAPATLRTSTYQFQSTFKPPLLKLLPPRVHMQAAAESQADPAATMDSEGRQSQGPSPEGKSNVDVDHDEQAVDAKHADHLLPQRATARPPSDTDLDEQSKQHLLRLLRALLVEQRLEEATWLVRFDRCWLIEPSCADTRGVCSKHSTRHCTKCCP